MMQIRSHIGKKIVSIAVLVLILAVVAVITTAPFIRADTLDKKIALQKDFLVQLRGREAKVDELRKQEEIASAPVENENVLLTGATVGIAGANLQKHVQAMVLKNGGVVSSIQVLPPSSEGEFTRIAVNLTLSIRNKGLRDLLYNLETQLPLNFVDEIVIRASNQQAGRSNLSSPSTLEATMEISGFIITRKAS